MKYVIIGNSAAAIGAVEGIRKTDKENPITIISAEPYHTYSRPLISYLLAGKVQEDKMYYRPKDFYEKNNVRFIYAMATALDTASKQVLLGDGSSVPYDKLLIATGGKPFVPSMAGLDKHKIFTFQKWDDIKKIEEVLPKSKKAIIIGAGLIGLKAAEALKYNDLDVTVIELSNRVLSSILDKDGAALVQEAMEDHGVKFIFEDTVTEILGNYEATGVHLASGATLECDLLIIAIGVVPNTDVARNTDIAINKGIVVDEHMATSNADIYAAGDVSEGLDVIMNARRVIPILPNAYKQGEIAGQNMVGCPVSYAGGFAMNAIGFFGYPMITAGIIGGQDFEEIIVSKPKEKLYRKIVIKDNQLIGFIAIKDINRVGILTSFISAKTDIAPFREKLLDSEFGYKDFPKDIRQERMLAGGVL